MLHHVEIYVSKLDASHAFWADILARIGWEQSGRWKDGFTLVNGDGAYLTFVQVATKYKSHTYLPSMRRRA
ncbi:VOC family protein [Rhizobium herbae]|uniref:VOC family protein n=1 Tax=Rhizobium herbae TaxID=508661 RepID=UPI001CB7A463|nr:hypothetical protein [Rhizobium herbae]